MRADFQIPNLKSQISDFKSKISKLKFKSARAPRRRSAFTLVELLLVITVIGILGTIVAGGSRMLIQTARHRRAKITREALNVALHRYRTEYQSWPVKKGDADDHSKRGGTSAYNGYEWYRWKKSNSMVFDALRTSNKTKNPDQLRFFDETALYTTTTGDDSGRLIPLSTAGTGSGKNLFYAKKRDNKPAYYVVWICYDTDEAEVGPATLEAGGLSEEDQSYEGTLGDGDDKGND